MHSLLDVDGGCIGRPGTEVRGLVCWQRSTVALLHRSALGVCHSEISRQKVRAALGSKSHSAMDSVGAPGTRTGGSLAHVVGARHQRFVGATSPAHGTGARHRRTSPAHVTGA